jgi:hypothetical protein
LGRLEHGEEVVQVRIAEATTLAIALTAGHGFSPDGRGVHPELAAAISRSVIRSLENPSLPLSLAGPPLSPRPGTFDYWSEADLVLMAELRALGRGGRSVRMDGLAANQSQVASDDPSTRSTSLPNVLFSRSPQTDGSDES